MLALEIAVLESNLASTAGKRMACGDASHIRRRALGCGKRHVERVQRVELQTIDSRLSYSADEEIEWIEIFVGICTIERLMRNSAKEKEKFLGLTSFSAY